MEIEIFSDLVCPWCLIGKRRLERALSERPRLAVARRWRPFQLNPDMPRGGMDRYGYLVAKFGSFERARQVYSVIENAAVAEGLDIDFGAIRRTPNTLDAHRTVLFAQGFGLGDGMTEILFNAYFRDGLDLEDRDLLCGKAAELGLDPGAVAVYLSGGDGVAEVQDSDRTARRYGMQAVPCFVFGRRYALAGAQEADAFLPLLDIMADAPPMLIGG